MTSIQAYGERIDNANAKAQYWLDEVKKAKSNQSKEMRKIDTHAKIFFGSLLISQLKGKDWTRINPTKYLDFLQSRNAMIDELICDEKGMSYDDANKRIREFEKNNKKKKANTNTKTNESNTDTSESQELEEEQKN